MTVIFVGELKDNEIEQFGFHVKRKGVVNDIKKYVARKIGVSPEHTVAFSEKSFLFYLEADKPLPRKARASWRSPIEHDRYCLVADNRPPYTK